MEPVETAAPGAPVYYARYGRGPEVYVALHGWSGSHRTFAPLLRYLPERVSLYAFDQPSYGRSPQPKTWTLDGLVDPIAEAIDQLGLFRYGLIGMCSGAVLAQRLAQRDPGRIERLVLIDPFFYAPWYFRIFTWGWLGRLFYFSTFANPLGRILTNLFLAKRRAEGTDLTGGFAGVDHLSALRYLNALVRADLGSVERLRDLSRVTELLIGEYTFGAVRRSVHEWRSAYWPDAPVTVLAGAGHLPIIEATEAAASALFGVGQSHGR